MIVAVIILALALAYALTMLGALGTLDQIAAMAWGDLLAGLRALLWLVVLAVAVILLAVLLAGALGRWLWSRHPGKRIRHAFWRRNRRGGRHVAAAQVTQ